MSSEAVLLIDTSLCFIVPNADIVAGWGEGTPGDVEPGGGGKELVGVLPFHEEIHERGELLGIFRADIGCLADKMLGVSHSANPMIDSLITEARINNNWPGDGSCGF